MQARSGPFWDGVEGWAPLPRAAATLGFEFVDADGNLIATATATARVIPLAGAAAAA
jgi:hypothetical protein